MGNAPCKNWNPSSKIAAGANLGSGHPGVPPTFCFPTAFVLLAAQGLEPRREAGARHLPFPLFPLSSRLCLQATEALVTREEPGRPG